MLAYSHQAKRLQPPFHVQPASEPRIAQHLGGYQPANVRMPTSITVFYTRRPDLSPTEFKAHMESVHVPLIKKLMGAHYPTTYLRHYVQRVESGAGDRLGASSASRKNAESAAPVVLVGTPGDLDWDMMGELIFRDELHLQQGFALLNSSGGQEMRDDEENFTVPTQLRVILMGETITA